MRILGGKLLFALSLLFLPFSTALACSCMSERPPCEEFGAARAVFIGTVTGAREHRQERDEDGKAINYDVGEIYFKVDEAFLGVKTATVTIHSGTGGGDCGYWFLRGKKYLVYAYGESPTNLGTNICTRTRRIEAADEDLTFLRNLGRKGLGARIYGSVVAALQDPTSEQWRRHDPLPGITVKIEGKTKTFDATTDINGKYEASGIPEGDYKVYADVPDTYARGEYWIREIHVNDRGCAEESFFAQNDSFILGRVLKSDGSPMSQARVEIVPVETKTMRRQGGDHDWSDEKGEFEFQNLPPGRYILGVNLSASPDKECPYPPLYYPGVTDRAQATVLEIGPADKLKDIDIHLPPPLAEQRIRGFVVWPNGSLAKQVEIYLEDIEYPGWCVNGCSFKTNDLGQFEVIGYEGYTYQVVSTADKPLPNGKTEGVYGVSEQFKLTGPVENLKVLISQTGQQSDRYKKDKDKEP